MAGGPEPLGTQGPQYRDRGVTSEPRAGTEILLPKEPEADAAGTGAELLPSFGPLSRCRGFPVAALSGHDLCKQLHPPEVLGGSGLHLSLFPSGCRTCWARCWTPWNTCTNWTSSTGDRGPGCFGRKAPRPLGRHCPRAGAREGGAVPQPGGGRAPVHSTSQAHGRCPPTRALRGFALTTQL